MIKKMIYGGVGLSVTLVIVGFLLTDKPDAYIPSSQMSGLVENGAGEDGFAIDPRDYDDDGDFAMPQTFDTYHLSEADLATYMKKNILSVGRDNPMMFQKEQSTDYSAGASYTWQDVVQETEVEDGHTLGYDINARSTGGNEIVSVEAASIEEKFAHYAVYPVDEKYYNFTSQYGPRMDPIEKEVEAFHGGIDIAQAGINGANIYSVLPGAVSHIEYNPNGYGHFIVINHGDFTTLYAHLKEEPTLNKGDIVQAGDIIGFVGTTGRSTGPHLHFEVSKDSVLIDPRPLLDSIGTGEPAQPPVVEESKDREDEQIDTQEEERESSNDTEGDE